MAGAHIRRSDARPLSIKPCFGQLPKYGSQPVRSDSCDVLQDDEAGSYQANGTHEFIEQP